MSEENHIIEGGHAMAKRSTKREALDSILDREGAEYYSSFPIDTPLAKSTALSALQAESVEIKERLNVPLQIYGFLVKPSDPKISRDGEINVYPISLLLCQGGEVIRSGSRGVLQSLRLFEAELGTKVWNPPITVTPKSRNIGDGKNWIYLSRLTNTGV